MNKKNKLNQPRYYIISLLAIFFFSFTANAKDFYISPKGNDSNDGTLKKPFATIAYAQSKVRAYKASNPSETITIYLRGGKYYLSKPIIFKAEDSGSEKHPIIYKAYKNEEPLILGGVKLNSLKWHKHDDKVEVIKLWILRRNNYYKKVINYFENKKNFIMVDINSENLKQDLSNFTNIKIETIVKSNVREKELPIVINFKKDIIKTFEALEIKKEDYTSIGVIDYI